MVTHGVYTDFTNKIRSYFLLQDCLKYQISNSSGCAIYVYNSVLHNGDILYVW